MHDRVDYLYVMIDSNGACWIVRDQGTEKAAGLASLLTEGWRPSRETPFHGVPYILITLERDIRSPEGFGFPKS